MRSSKPWLRSRAAAAAERSARSGVDAAVDHGRVHSWGHDPGLGVRR